MNRTSVVVAVLVAGYSLYGGLAVAGVAVHDSLAVGSTVPAGSDAPDRAASGSDGATNSGTLAFESVEVGLNYSHVSETRGHMEMVSSAGVYVGDYDGDGWPDVLAVGGERPVLFENRNGTFEQSGALPEVDQDVRSAAFADYNLDGRPDIILLAEDSPPLLLENVGGGFERRESVFERSLDVPFGGTVADFDRDGCPDLFVYEYGDWLEEFPVGQVNYSAPLNGDNGNPDHLYWGNCSGFRHAENAGIEGDRWTLVASAVDLDGDGYPDIHAANDFNHDVVYANRGNGTFEQVVLPERTNRNGMSSEVADVTGNGNPNVFVTNIYYPDWAAERINAETKLKARGNNLVGNLGDHAYVNRGEQYGVTKGGFGWAATIADFDNDGDEDLFHTTRQMTFERRDVLFSDEELEELRGHSYYSYPAVWERADANAFSRVDPEDAGFEGHDGRGVARLDYDRDGDLDLVVATTGEFRVYENAADGRNAVQVRVLDENGSQTGAYGATVFVDAGDQQRRVHARSDFLSQESRLVHVGVGDAETVDVRVVWADGTERVFEDVPAARRLVVTPGGVREETALD